jgi:hypothetical protein
MGRAKSGYAATAPVVHRSAAAAAEVNTVVRHSRKELEVMADELEADAPTTPLEKVLAVGTAVALAEEPEITGLVLRAHRIQGNWIQYRVRWLEGTESLQGDENWGDYSRSDLVIARAYHSAAL